MAHRVYISHVWQERQEFRSRLIVLLKRAQQRFGLVDLAVSGSAGLEAINYADVKDRILAALSCADVMLALNGPISSSIEPCKDELALADSLAIPVVALTLPSRRSRRGSFEPLQAGHQARWITKNIRDAIQNAISEKPRPVKSDPEPGQYVPLSLGDASPYADEVAEPKPAIPVLSTDFSSLLVRKPIFQTRS